MTQKTNSQECVIDDVHVALNNPAITAMTKRFLLDGSYEIGERTLFHHFPKDLPIIELGAGIGVVACVVNRQLKNPGQHIVVEANPNILKPLEETRDRNHCQFKILNAAVAYGASEIQFNIHGEFLASSVQKAGKKAVSVPTTSLNAVAEANHFPTFNLIADIEFAEYELIRNELNFMKEHTQWFLVEMHKPVLGKGKIPETDARLKQNGFELIEAFHQKIFCYRNRNLSK